MPRARKLRLDITPEFARALDLMERGSGHVFVTGKAGTGKSTLLEHFRRTTGKNVAVLAPTGVAALNVRGQTIHSFFGFKPDVVPDKVGKLGRTDSRAGLLAALDAIVIDEVSMVRADLLDCVDRFLRLNGRRPREPFGGLRMIFIGDLYQLPPVVTSRERDAFRYGYDSPYFFSARAFADPEFDLAFVELEKVYRQTEADFITLLNAIRNRTATEEDLGRLNARYDPDEAPTVGDFRIVLTSTNDLAAARNLERLEALPGRPLACRGAFEGEFDPGALPTDEVLTLKEDAQVMLVNNDRLGRWVNGTLGRVAGFGRPGNGGGRDVVLVELEDGDVVEVEPYTWELFAYAYDRKAGRLTTEPRGAFTQFPLKLAWAVTIHKSQGKTFDRVVVDIGRGAFAHGQVYVALSRCTRFEGLVLTRPIRPDDLRLDWRIVRFLTRFQYRKAEERESTAGRRARVLAAIRDGRELDILYLKTDDTKTRRRIRPLAVEAMEFKGRGFEGVRAWCRLRGEERVFRVDRMLEVEEAAEDKDEKGLQKRGSTAGLATSLPSCRDSTRSRNRSACPGSRRRTSRAPGIRPA